MLEYYRNEFNHLHKQLPGQQLPWLQQLRQNALDDFIKQGFPNFHHEDWKYTNVTPIAKHEFKQQLKLNAAISSNDLQAFINPKLDCFRLVFIDGHFAAQLSTLDKISSCITITNLAQALEKNAAPLQRYLDKHTQHQSISFTPLNTAFFTDGAYIHLPPNVSCDKPIELLFIASAATENTTNPLRNLIIAEANSQIKIIENYISLGEKNHFTNTVTELAISEHAHVEHYKLLQENQSAFHIGTLQVEQQAHSHFTSHSFAWGGKLVRSDTQVYLRAPHAACILNGLYLANGQQHIDHHTLIDHCKPHGTSRERYKGIIADQARAVFNGKVYVHPHAQKTDAQQTNKNLLLSDQAEIDTKPQLEIYADDVQCSHGTTIGQLDEDALFYLRSRGIPEAAARTALIYAFAREMIERVSIMPLREQLQKQLEGTM